MNTRAPSPAAGALAELERELRSCVRGEVHFDRMSCGLHATDASHYQMMPACVATPRDEADCIAAVSAAGRCRVPITPRGGGTSLSGQTFGPGLVLDVSKYMDRILELNVEQRWARVQPGMIRDLLNVQLAPHRLHFAPDPATGNRATVGGMIGRYVHDLGSGLMVVGGEKTFGDAVFHDTPLERLLPVTAAAAATETERSVLAMVLIIDRSGSMEQDRRLDLAKEAAQQSVRVLDAHDKAGVIAFSDDAEWIAPLATVADKADLLQRIATLTAYG